MDRKNIAVDAEKAKHLILLSHLTEFLNAIP